MNPQTDRARAARGVDLSSALHAAVDLRGWFERADLRGVDPYDALRSPVVARLARTPRLRQAAVQALRRLPVDPRPLLAIRPYRNAKGLALVAAASARLWSLSGDERWRALAQRAADEAATLAVETSFGPAWGYPFDVQVRWGFYAEGTPNAVATVFTAGGLLVAGEILGQPELVEKAEATAPFLDSLATGADEERYFSYVPGNRSAIHNANLLVAALRARLSRRREEEIPEDTLRAVRYSLGRQRQDGSWPYGEGPGLGWVDGFHTAYVLCALLDLSATTGCADVDAALGSGTPFYLDKLFGTDGAPLIAPGRRYPVDTHNVATAVATLSRIGDRNPRAHGLAPVALEFAFARLRTKNGSFIYQRGRAHAKRPAYLRWSNAHMLNALAEFVRAESGVSRNGQGGACPVP